MIGGADRILPAPDVVSSWDVVFHVVARHWPDYVYHDASDPAFPSARHSPSTPAFSGQELLIYRDVDAARSWFDEGATDQDATSMLYLIHSEDSEDLIGKTNAATLTIVHHDDGELEELLEGIESGLHDVCRPTTAERS